MNPFIPQAMGYIVSLLFFYNVAPSAGSVKFNYCIFAEVQDSPDECSVPSLPGPLWPRVVALKMVLSMGQIELFDI